MTQNRRIVLNIVATYGRSLYALVIGLFCGRGTLMSSGTAARGRIDWVNRKVYNTTHQMTARTDRSELGRYSPAYATGRSAFALESKSNRGILVLVKIDLVGNVTAML